MAKPRVFVSSTYYDLKHLRSSLENFIESLGFEAVLSEKGDIAYAPDVALDESCYREVRNADIFVLIIGGRYGSEKSSGDRGLPKAFFERYDSITKQEYQSAVERDIPIYVLVERSVYAEFQTFGRNKDSKEVNYAHVDSVNVFHLIENILAKGRNNPVFEFDRYGDIEAWLKEQWSGLFKELLGRMTSQQQIKSLSSQVAELAEVNETLKRYLEEVVEKVAPDKAAEVVSSETERLARARQEKLLRQNRLVNYLSVAHDAPFPLIIQALSEADARDPSAFASELSRLLDRGPAVERDLRSVFQSSHSAVEAYEEAVRIAKGEAVTGGSDGA